MSGDNKTLTIRLIGNSKSAVGAMGATERAGSSLGAKVGKISGALKGAGKMTMGWGARLTAVTAGVGFFIARAGAPYVASLNKIQVLTSSNNATMRKTAGFLERNSAKYAAMGQTVGDAAGGVVELTKAGMSLHDSLRAVNGTMVLAKAGELSVADASTLVANTLNTFGLKAKRAGDIANYLANAANISSADVSDLAEAFKYVAPVAAAANVKLETVNALLAELANKGIGASQAGTGLRNWFLALQAPAGAGGKAIKSLGVDVFDASGKARPFKKVLGDLAVAIKKVDDKTRATDLKAIFGKTGINAAQVILGSSVKGLNRYEKGVVKAGAATRLAKSASKGLAGTWLSLKAMVTSLAQQLYRQLSPSFDKVLKVVQKFVAGFSKLSPHTKKLIAIFAACAAAAGPLLLALGFIATALGVLLSPVGLVLAALIGIGVGFAIAMKKSEGFRKGVQKIGSNIGPIFSKIGDVVKKMIPPIVAFGKKLWAAIGPGLKQIAELIKTELMPALVKIAPIIAPIAKFLLKMFGAALIGAIKGVIQMIKGFIQVISGVISLIADLIHGDWSAVWHDLGNIVKGVFNLIVGFIKVWWNAGVLGIFKHGFTALIGLVKNGWKIIPKLFKGGVKLVEKGLAGLVRLLTAPFRAGFKSIGSFTKTGWAYIRGRFGVGVAGIKAVLRRVLEVVTYPFRNALRIGKDIVRTGIGAVRDLFAKAPGRIKTALSGIKNAVLGALKGAGKWLLNIGKDIIRGLLRGIGAMIGQVQDKFHSLTKMIPDWKGPPAKDRKLLEPAGKSIMGGLMRGLSSKFGNVRSMLTGFTGDMARTALGAPLAGFGGSAGSMYAGGPLRASAGGVAVYITVEGNLIGEKDFAKRVTPTVRDELSKIGKRNGGDIFGSSKP